MRQFRRACGEIVLSFGGQAGTELARACTSVKALAAAYSKAISAYGATRVDFDIEGAALADRAANTRRTEAIARLRHLRVSFTLPVLPSGLDAQGLAVLRGAVAHGVAVSVVNAMAMDYGDAAAPAPDGKMGAYAIQAAQALERQLHGIYPRLGAAALWRKVGVTPMIGINDVATETFTLADAQQLAAFARSRHIGLLSMWQLGRDRACAKPVRTAQVDCSGVAQDPWQFARALGSFHG